MKINIGVGNTYDHCGGEYIGRNSPLGNPFVMKPGALSRYQVVDMYSDWLDEKIRTGDAVVIAELERLAYIAMERPLILRCFCAPQRCHGDVIKQVLETAIQNHIG